MAEPALQQSAPQQPAQEDPRESLIRLLAHLASGAKFGASAAAAGMPAGRQWGELEQAVSRRLASCTNADRAIARHGVIAAAAQLRLQTVDATGARAAAYGKAAEDIAQRVAAWEPLAPQLVLCRHLHEAMLWLTAWHLLVAGIPMPKVIRAIEAEDARQVNAPTRAPRMPLPDDELDLETMWANARMRIGAAASRAMGLVWDTAHTIATYRQEQQRKAAQRKADYEALVEKFRAEERAEEEKAARLAAEEQAATPPATHVPDETPGPAIALNGQRLRGSVVGTWLLLVVMSWVSLIWGILISLPFGLGLGLMTTAGLGIVVVPLWGTLFGFFGMGGARDSTLKQMGFQELPEGHVLRSIAAHYCQAIDIPVPRLGTIGAHNAFAMGTDRNDATVAIGRPLIDSLSPRETAAVLAHELGHVVSGDMRKMMLMRTFQNATVWFAGAQGLKQIARWILSWAAELWILAFSRKREYWADAIGAALAGKDAMMGALEKLDQAPALTADERVHARFMVRGKAFSTHPSTAERIKALKDDTFIRRLPKQ